MGHRLVQPELPIRPQKVPMMTSQQIVSILGRDNPLVIRNEKAYSRLLRLAPFAMGHILAKLAYSEVGKAKALCPRFKE